MKILIYYPIMTMCLRIVWAESSSEQSFTKKIAKERLKKGVPLEEGKLVKKYQDEFLRWLLTQSPYHIYDKNFVLNYRSVLRSEGKFNYRNMCDQLALHTGTTPDAEPMLSYIRMKIWGADLYKKAIKCDLRVIKDDYLIRLYAHPVTKVGPNSYALFYQPSATTRNNEAIIVNYFENDFEINYSKIFEYGTLPANIKQTYLNYLDKKSLRYRTDLANNIAF